MGDDLTSRADGAEWRTAIFTYIRENKFYHGENLLMNYASFHLSLCCVVYTEKQCRVERMPSKRRVAKKDANKFKSIFSP